MEDEEGLYVFGRIGRQLDVNRLNLGLDSVFGIDDPLSAYHKIDSVKRLGEIGVYVTFYNRNKIIHNYGK